MNYLEVKEKYKSIVLLLYVYLDAVQITCKWNLDIAVKV